VAVAFGFSRSESKRGCSAVSAALLFALRPVLLGKLAVEAIWLDVNLVAFRSTCTG
jgi:hypothetical protein